MLPPDLFCMFSSVDRVIDRYKLPKRTESNPFGLLSRNFALCTLHSTFYIKIKKRPFRDETK